MSERNDDQVVEREDAQRAPRVEAGEVAFAAARVDQDAGDQESGEHEEQIDARPADIGPLREDLVNRRHWLQNEIVMEQNEEDSDAAEAIERGRVSEQRSR